MENKYIKDGLYFVGDEHVVVAHPNYSAKDIDDSLIRSSNDEYNEDIDWYVSVPKYSVIRLKKLSSQNPLESLYEVTIVALSDEEVHYQCSRVKMSVVYYSSDHALFGGSRLLYVDNQ